MKHNPPKQFTVVSTEKPLIIYVFHDGQTSHPKSGYAIPPGTVVKDNGKRDICIW